jgi:hypothetical protein
MDEERETPDVSPNGDRRKDPPGDFTSKELEEDTARFLEEVRRRAEKQRRHTRRRRGPPPAERG